MKNEMILPMSLSARVKTYIQSVGEGMSQLYSQLLEEPISVAQSWKLLHASVAVVSTVFLPLAWPLRALSVVWMIYALLECRRAGLR